MLTGRIQGPVLFILKNRFVTLSQSKRKTYAILTRDQKKTARNTFLRSIKSHKKKST
jgi:hypothetical protein